MKQLESDLMFPLSSRRRAEDILFANKATYHVQLFSGVEHGFAVRGDPEIENDRTLSLSVSMLQAIWTHIGLCRVGDGRIRTWNCELVE